MQHEVSLKWFTPNGQALIANIARVSNPANENNDETAPRLIRHLIKHNHWSPFEMVNACVEIHTSRDIGRQILRHRSFSFQEFSGRYAEYSDLRTDREGRLQDKKNRQASLHTTDPQIMSNWDLLVKDVSRTCAAAYRRALELGIAKECARALLPEGLVPTRMYMNGTLRSWIHYTHERMKAGVQEEHKALATSIAELLFYGEGAPFPDVWEALAGTYQG